MAADTPRRSTKRARSSGSKAKKPATRKPAARKTTSNGSTRSTSRSTASSNSGNGVVETVKSAAGKAAGPAVAVGAAAVGIAGGIVLKTRTRRKTVLGVKLPRSIGKSLPDIDAKSIAKSVGHASKQFAKTTKGVSKDLERAGDQAERIGKILD
jgi:hypothetical protein